MSYAKFLAGLIIVSSACGPCLCMPAAACVVRDLPTVETVMNSAVKAVGGREALDKVKTLHTVMAMNSSGQDIEMDTSWSRRGGRLMKVKMDQMDMAMGTDGATAWMKGPMGYMLAGEEQKSQINQAAMHMNMLDPTLRDKKDMESVKVVAKEGFQGRECYKLSYDKNGQPGFIFFDSDSGLPVGSVQEDGERKSTTVFGDWKKVNGVLFFHSITFETTGGRGMRGGMNGNFKVHKLEVNTVDESAFALPEEVKKLASDRKPDAASAPAPGEIKLEDLSAEEQKEAKKMTQSLGMIPDVKTLKSMESSISQAVGMMPANKKKPMEYTLQEIRKEIAKRGG